MFDEDVQASKHMGSSSMICWRVESDFGIANVPALAPEQVVEKLYLHGLGAAQHKYVFRNIKEDHSGI